MRLIPRLVALVSLAAAGPALAEVPSVAADVAPIHGLVARVMQGVAEPELIVRPGASPHGYALRPSEARALQEAGAVFWLGDALEPWLAGSLDSLAGDATVVELLEVPGTLRRSFRTGTTFAAHDPAEEAGQDDHGHDEAGPAEADDAHGQAGAADSHDHDGDVDPHAWLDPENGKLWLDAIAAELSRIDPGNAAAYAANAAAGRDEIDATVARIEARLAGLEDLRFVVFHDAYQYFEARFGVTAAGAISLSDASDPSPARIAEIRAAVADRGVSCVFSEPQFNQDLVRTVFEGTEARAAVIDPLGADIPTGPGFYPALLTAVADEIAACR